MGQSGLPIPGVQIHDYNPGIMPNGVFWTIPIAASAVTADLRRGTARYRLKNLPLRDSRHAFNALIVEGPSERAVATFDVTWTDPTKRFTVRDEANTFGGSFIETTPKIAFSVDQEGFAFTSAPAAQSGPVFGVIGAERNGVFFK